LNLFISDSSDDTSSDEETYQQRLKRKQKQKKQIQKILKKFAAEKEKQKKKEEEKKNKEGPKTQKSKDKDSSAALSHLPGQNKSPRSSRSPMITLKRKKAHHNNTDKHQNYQLVQVQYNNQNHALNDNLFVIKGQLKRSLPPNQVNLGKDFINLEFAESQMQTRLNKHSMQKINKGP